ncbi:MAG: anti-sigma factor [Actinobacteria bacterium]|nr:anti-sigma factor [Actinomycetota bacterium]
MATGHDHFEELAVGHVLGGLEQDAAARFRAHLTRCRDCRARVSELRGIASDLQAAERDELARARVKTEVARRDDHPEPFASAWLLPSRALLWVVTVSVALAIGLAFWNFHLRAQQAAMLEVADAREAILEGLATGAAVPTELAGAVTGQVVADATHVTVDLAGLPAIGPDESYVVWLLGEEPTDSYWRAYGRDELPEGRLAFRDLHRRTDRLVISVERDRGDVPAGRELLDADLSART